VLIQLARWRVPVGFACAMVALLLARPASWSWWSGAGVALVGEGLRVWAAGHIEKGREITRSGPYRFVRHPLYVGSAILGLGFALAARHAAVWMLTAAYLAITLSAAIRVEERTLDERFAGEYSAYREGRATPVDRPFSWSRVAANREYRAMAGAVLAFAWLAYRLTA
jgi:protein-S-isoprenylcysteine O-methyltransferase Ste14